MSASAEASEVNISPEEVREALRRVVNSETLGGSERLCRFLTYSVDAALEGRSKELNQYQIGLDVFDKPETFDPVVDPIVRVEAGRLRDKLDRYYAGEGAADPVRLRFAARGYATRFERCVDAPAKVQTSEGEAFENDSANSTTEALDGDGPVSVAVLPFVDLSPERDQEAFCDGVTVELINHLAVTERLRVVSRSLSFQFKGEAVDVLEVGRKLGVDALLEGSVRRYEKESRITAQLSDATDGFLLWAGSYTADNESPLEVQEQVVDSISEALDAMLQRRKGATAEKKAKPGAESAPERADAG